MTCQLQPYKREKPGRGRPCMGDNLQFNAMKLLTIDSHYLRAGQSFSETEDHIIAIQVQLISTKNYLKNIIKDENVQDDRSRMCEKEAE